VPLLQTLPRLFAASLRGRESPTLTPWISRDLVERFDLIDRCRLAITIPPSDHPIRPLAWSSLQLPVWQTLFDTCDPAYTAVPFETGFPFLDLRVVRFLLRMPVVPWGRRKYALRYAFRGELPHTVWRRPKIALAAFPLVEKAR